MKKLFTFLIISLVITSAAFSSGGSESSASEEGTYVFKYSNAQVPSHPRTQSMFFFKEELEKRTNGRIKVEIYHSGVLGNEKEQLDQMTTGIIQGFRGGGYDLFNKKYYLYNIPFLFSDVDEVIKFSNSDFMKKVNEETSKNSPIYVPAVGSSGFRNIVNNVRALEKPDDFKGIKFRVPPQLPLIEFFKTLGAFPQAMQSSEVYLALSSNVIDGADSSNADLDQWKVAEVTKYLTIINYVSGADPFMVNKEWFMSLPDDLKNIFNEVAVETMIKNDQLRKVGDELALENLKKQIKNVNYVEGDIRNEFKEKLEPVWRKMVAEGYFSEADVKEVQKFLE